MIAAVIEKDMLDGIGAPKVISSDAQNERYISALLEMERRSRLTAEEKNFMELLTLLVEAYEEKQYPIRSVTPVEVSPAA